MLFDSVFRKLVKPAGAPRLSSADGVTMPGVLPAVSGNCFVVWPYGESAGDRETYEPGPVLWLEFLEVATFADVLSFAARYGPLAPESRWRSEFEGGDLVIREDVQTWLYAVGELRKAHLLAQSLGNPDELRRLGGEFDTLDPTDAAGRWLQKFVTGNLAHGMVTVDLVWNRTRKRMERGVRAYSLHGFIWHQFAEAVVHTKEYGRCEYCGSLFEVRPKARGKQKKYCTGNVCRSKAWQAQ